MSTKPSRNAAATANRTIDRTPARLGLAACAIAVLVGLAPSRAFAWSVESLATSACHETLTSEALRRTEVGQSLSRSGNRPSDLVESVIYAVPDHVNTLEAISLLEGARFPDLEGYCSSDFATVLPLHNNSGTQQEHCIRERHHDDEQGDEQALAECRDYIQDRLSLALDTRASAGGPADGLVEKRTCLQYRGETEVDLVAFYFYFGEALHAFQDTFTHTYRVGADLEEVGEVLNWLEQMDGDLDPERDGPPHSSDLDNCESGDPRAQARREAAIAASAELIEAMTAEVDSEEEREERVEAVLDRWLTYRPGCTLENDYCGSEAFQEALDAEGAGCSVAARPAEAPFALVVVVLGVAAAMRRS